MNIPDTIRFRLRKLADLADQEVSAIGCEAMAAEAWEIGEQLLKLSEAAKKEQEAGQ